MLGRAPLRRPSSRRSALFTKPALFLVIGVTSLALALLLLLISLIYDGRNTPNLDSHPASLSSALPPSDNVVAHPDPQSQPVAEPAANADIDTSSRSEHRYTDAIPVVIFTFNRPENLRTTLDSLFKHLPATGHPIYVSQDGDDRGVATVIASYGDRVTHLQFTYTATPDPMYALAYQKIAAHYNFALTQVFDARSESANYDRVIMLEDDMRISPDFFSLFRALAPLFDTDPSLYCVSAWNDNGQPSLVHDPLTLYRTECFPGLGWMMSRSLWTELGSNNKWTWGFWDDWLREPPQRKSRSCIYPEINRANTFGAVGTSGGQFYDQYLKYIQINTENIDWSGVDVSYLSQDNYDRRMTALLKSAVLENDVAAATREIEAELSRGSSVKDVRERKVRWHDLNGLTTIIAPLGMITDHKADIPRTAYKGVLQFRHRGVRIFLVKSDSPLLGE